MKPYSLANQRFRKFEMFLNIENLDQFKMRT